MERHIYSQEHLQHLYGACQPVVEEPGKMQGITHPAFLEHRKRVRFSFSDVIGANSIEVNFTISDLVIAHLGVVHLLQC